ncbi:acetolactate synthase 2 small subunit [Alginatibacterium sediminis]|uniref:Acetolactate synthase 2 small subunit n=1 Tax=Alginatibacterium sediminis TaxID=2164068 RepID=A0A420ELP4_9ALTE|nr:acetolactate synthase 2 small subunit [Alginatibacterium sediminis]RKF21524.1 acetolactate synthase 2 small subunit [Alginatibacterium sediminis]
MSDSQVHQLKLVCNNSPEVMERVLRVVRHRGFVLDNLSMQKLEREPQQQQLEIQLRVTSVRPITQLQAQLEKLFDVAEVTLQQDTKQPQLKKA